MITYEEILERMLDRIPEGFDKREGSIIFDALAPAAVELQLLYLDLENLIKETFADSASRDFLIRRARERGIIPYPSSFAILKAVAKPSDVEIPRGARFNLEDLNYKVVEKIGPGIYQVECESPGSIGNKYFGTLIPIEYIDGLESIEITELLIAGEDEEETESIRTRYFDSFDSKAYGGNIKDYIQKTNSIAGVGATKVTPVWKGGGTVLLTILDSDFNRASETLIKKVQEEIDPEPQSKGLGIAPIGHRVTVRTADEVKVNIKTKISWKDDKDLSQVKEIINKYLGELRKTWDKEENLIVRISQIESRILGLDGVLDIGGTQINDKEENLIIDMYGLPVIGDVLDG